MIKSTFTEEILPGKLRFLCSVKLYLFITFMFVSENVQNLQNVQNVQNFSWSPHIQVQQVILKAGQIDHIRNSRLDFSTLLRFKNF